MYTVSRRIIKTAEFTETARNYSRKKHNLFFYVHGTVYLGNTSFIKYQRDATFSVYLVFYKNHFFLFIWFFIKTKFFSVYLVFYKNHFSVYLVYYKNQIFSVYLVFYKNQIFPFIWFFIKTNLFCLFGFL